MTSDLRAAGSRRRRDRFERWMEIIPYCQREGGRMPLARLAEWFGEDESTVLRDVEALADREYYLTSRFDDSLLILIERERVSIHDPGYFDRPLRLAPLEALALQLGLQGVAAETPSAERAELEEASRALARAMTAPAVRTAGPRAGTGGGPAGPGGGPGGPAEGERDLVAYGRPMPDASAHAFAELRRALREHEVVELRYFKPHDPDDAPVRRVQPWALAEAHGAWYLLAREGEAAAPKRFRLDRVLEVRPTGDRFEPPSDPRLEEHIDPERVYRGDEDDLEVVIRYSPRIARWIEERYDGDAVRRRDGSVEVRHRCKSPSWAIARAFRYGGDAAIVEPPAVRELARRTLESMGGAAA